MSKLKKALNKAKALREETNHVEQPIPVPRTLPLKRPVQERKIKPRQSQKELKISYKSTRIQKVDPSILRRNKIFSLFKDIRMTAQVDILRTQILNRLKEIDGNSLLVTSARPGEGKTFTSINLAVSIAQQLDRSVLLVDADLRDPWKNHCDFAGDFFGIKADAGLADYLKTDVELSEVLINPGIEKLTILPAGRALPNSAELLGSVKMEELIVEVKSRYGSERVIIFDSPALLACTDPLVFSDMIDGILLVVEAEKTTPDELNKAVQLLKDRQLLGTVFNKKRSL